MRRSLAGSAVGIVLSVALGAAMVPFRSHLSIATAGLVLVVPVVAGVVTGGFPAGIVGVLAGFLVYDLAFIRPYVTLGAGRPQNWVVLGVYVVVMALVARVVAHLESARADAQRRTTEAHRLVELSELLVEDRSVDDLLQAIVRTVASVFGVQGVSLLVLDPSGPLLGSGRLTVAASAGEALAEEDLRRLDPRSGVPVSLGTGPEDLDKVQTVALTVSSRPIGMLAMRNMPARETDRAVLRTFANHAALAVERARLREQALRSQVLEEVDRLRHALVGAVSHDLRTPLATMKVASSTLLDAAVPLSDDDVRELHGLIDVETDRLTRLVTSLLDMTRIEAGVLEVRRSPRSVLDLASDALTALRSALGDRPVDVLVPDDLPEVDADPLLIGQVLANLLDNANRHAPPGSPVTVAGEVRGDRVAIAVTDAGPGVPPAERQAVFDRFVRFDTGGRTGLGLAIAKTFVEAHGEHIWVEDVPGGGARFVFTLPRATPEGSDEAPGPAGQVAGAVGR